MHNWFAICATILVAMVLALLPMPDWTIWLRPAWVLLILIYWAMTVPSRVSEGVAWVTGLLMDLLHGSVLGEHAMAYTVVIYFVSRLHMRLRMYPMLQQGLSVFMFVLLYQFIIYCIQGFIGDLPASRLYWMSSVTSMLLWPWLFILMRDWRQWLRVA